MNILLIEDELPIREGIAAYLVQAGYRVWEAGKTDAGWRLLGEHQIALIILDLNLPGEDGVTFCRRLREFSDIPVIMLTARSEEWEEIAGLKTGADDYIKKPFSPSLLLTRVQVLLRRHYPQKLQFDDLEINAEERRVTLAGKSCRLTTTQFDILYFLSSHPGQVFTREAILDGAYAHGASEEVLERTIDAHIKGIRKMIEPPHNPRRYIETVIGRGYRFWGEEDATA